MKIIRKETIKYTDFISNYFYQQIAFLITSFLMKTKITPNIVTLISLIFGLLSAFFVFKHSIVLSIVFLNISFILDCVDGQLARVKRLESDFGMWLDNISDRIVENAIVLSIALAYLHDKMILIGSLFLLFLNMQYAYMSDMVIYQNNSEYRKLTTKEKIIFSPIYFISRSMIIPMLSLLILFPGFFVWVINILYVYGIVFRVYREMNGKI
jgi:phosphatidylglycerophosphate synthase